MSMYIKLPPAADKAFVVFCNQQKQCDGCLLHKYSYKCGCLTAFEQGKHKEDEVAETQQP